MKIDDETVNRISKLANLEFDKEGKVAITNDLNKILEFVEQLNEVDTEGIEPLVYMNEEEDQLREDEITFEITQKEALKNAPDKDSDYFKVPKVLDKSDR